MFTLILQFFFHFLFRIISIFLYGLFRIIHFVHKDMKRFLFSVLFHYSSTTSIRSSSSCAVSAMIP